jgi:hypothetical protein
VVAVDSVGAGFGERVYVCRGREASFAFSPAEVPSDATVVGIVDEAGLEEVAPALGETERPGDSEGEASTEAGEGFDNRVDGTVNQVVDTGDRVEDRDNSVDGTVDRVKDIDEAGAHEDR